METVSHEVAVFVQASLQHCAAERSTSDEFCSSRGLSPIVVAHEGRKDDYAFFYLTSVNLEK